MNSHIPTRSKPQQRDPLQKAVDDVRRANSEVYDLTTVALTCFAGWMYVTSLNETRQRGPRGLPSPYLATSALRYALMRAQEAAMHASENAGSLNMVLQIDEMYGVEPPICSECCKKISEAGGPLFEEEER